MPDIKNGMEKGIEKGMKRGMKRGMKNGIEKIAIKLLKQGLDFEFVKKVTEIPIEEIEKIKAKL